MPNACLVAGGSVAAHSHRRYAARVSAIRERAGRSVVVIPMERIVRSELVRRREKDALSKIIVPASPGRSTISAGAVASALAVIGRAAINCCAACQSADRQCSEK
jgi:hypothetical protein